MVEANLFRNCPIARSIQAWLICSQLVTRTSFSPISGAFLHKDTANCDTFTKIGTNEGYTMLINLRPGGILGVTAFCLNFDKIQHGRRPSIHMQFYVFYSYLGEAINCSVSNNHFKNIHPPFATELWTSFDGVNVFFVFLCFLLLSYFIFYFYRYFVIIIILLIIIIVIIIIIRKCTQV